MELLPSLISGLKTVCAAFPDSRQGRTGNMAMADFGLSAFAMFFMQSVSFLAFQRRLEQGYGRSNCQTLFGIEKIPSDNYIRNILDGTDPALLQPCFARVEQLLTEPPVRQAFARLGGRIIVALDGTEYFRSEKLGCGNCLTCKHSNGKIDHYHTLLAATVVAPGHSKVIPLFPEFIVLSSSMCFRPARVATNVAFLIYGFSNRRAFQFARLRKDCTATPFDRLSRLT